jgi:peptide/nickel transport system permease protein
MMVEPVSRGAVAGSAVDAIRVAPAKRGYWRAVRRKLARDPIAITCGIVLILIMLAAVFAPLIAPADPYRTSVARRLLPIGSPNHILGTDELGRDMLSRLIYGGRVSLLMGLLPVLCATLMGSLIGIVAGFAGRWVNMILMRIVDVFFAFPSVLLAVALAGVMGAGLVNCLVALSLVLTPSITRIAESATTQIRNQGFVEAARATGASTWRIVVGHVLSNVMGPILTYASSQISVAIVLASGLSFLGLGVTAPTADWGLMLNTLRQSLWVAPVNAILPGVMILVTSVCFNLLSDGLRTALDVKP